MADEKLHGASALLLRALRQQHVRTLHSEIVAVRIGANHILGFTVNIVDVGAVVAADVRLGDAGGGEEKQQHEQCARKAAAHHLERR